MKSKFVLIYDGKHGVARANRFVFNPHYHGAGSGFFRNLLHLPYRYFGAKIFQKADKVILYRTSKRGLFRKRALVLALIAEPGRITHVSGYINL